MSRRNAPTLPRKGQKFAGTPLPSGEYPPQGTRFFYSQIHRTPDNKHAIEWVDASGKSGTLIGQNIASIRLAKDRIEKGLDGIQTSREIVHEVQSMASNIMRRRRA